MSSVESKKDTCKNCGHRLQSHLKEKDGKCEGDSDDVYSWCIANCERFWE